MCTLHHTCTYTHTHAHTQIPSQTQQDQLVKIHYVVRWKILASVREIHAEWHTVSCIGHSWPIVPEDSCKATLPMDGYALMCVRMCAWLCVRNSLHWFLSVISENQIGLNVVVVRGIFSCSDDRDISFCYSVTWSRCVELGWRRCFTSSSRYIAVALNWAAVELDSFPLSSVHVLCCSLAHLGIKRSDEMFPREQQSLMLPWRWIGLASTLVRCLRPFLGIVLCRGDCLMLPCRQLTAAVVDVMQPMRAVRRLFLRIAPIGTPQWQSK